MKPNLSLYLLISFMFMINKSGPKGRIDGWMDEYIHSYMDMSIVLNRMILEHYGITIGYALWLFPLDGDTFAAVRLC